MAVDILDLMEFYATSLGQYVRQNLSAQLQLMAAPAEGENLIGYGYAAPYVAPLCAEGVWHLLMPAQQGVMREHAVSPSLMLVEETRWPVRDDSVACVLAAHALENSNDITALLDEMWRVLVPGGRAVVIVPNRRGFWARRDATPFGVGRPFSSRQLKAHVMQTGFSLAHMRPALMLPPLLATSILCRIGGLENIMRFIAPQLGGVWVVQAVKQVSAPIRARGRAARPVGGLARPAFSRVPVRINPYASKGEHYAMPYQ